MDEDKLFKDFLEGYLRNVVRELPQSYRAQQLKAGGFASDAVYEFETRFLKEPFLKAVREAVKDG